MFHSPNTVRVRRYWIIWVGYVAGLGDNEDAYRACWGNLQERDHLENLGVDGRFK
jgi:hypothetical protein